MSLALTEKDAWAEVFNFISVENPVMGTDPTKWRPVKIEKHATNETLLKLVVASNDPTTVSGHLTIEYAAADLGKYINHFGELTKPPQVFFFGDVGKNYKLSDVIDIVNNVTGLELSMSGQYVDIEDQTFVAPAKGSNVVLTISPKAIPVGGSAYFPMRLISTKKAVISIDNRGSKLSSVMPNRALNPFVDANNELVWSGERQNVDAPTFSYLPGLINLDFTDIFGTPSLLNGAFNAGGTDAGNSTYWLKLNDATRALINARLATVGIPPIDRTVGVYDGVSRDRNRLVRDDSLVTYSSQDQATFGDLNLSFVGRHFQYFGASGDRGGKAPAWIKDNVKKRYFIRIAPPGYTDKGNYFSALEDYNVAADKKPMSQRSLYLFFNALSV